MPAPSPAPAKTAAPSAPALEGLALWIFRTEAALTGICVLMFSNAFWGPVFEPAADVTYNVDSSWMRLLWLPVYAVTVLLSLVRAERFRRILPGLAMATALCALCFASSQWSIDPAMTNRRAIAVTATSLFGLYLAARWRGGHLTQILAVSFAVLAAGSYIAAIAFPAVGIAHDINAGDWKGLWYEKNQMAAMMVLGFIAACASAWAVPRRRRLWLGVAAAIFGLVVLSHSATSLVVCILVVGAYPVLMAMEQGGLRAVIVFWLAGAAALAGAAVILIAPDMVFAALGKDPTLTGRTEIWASLGRLSAKHPWLGYGYKAFWGPDSIPNKIVRRETHWDVPSAHNGWLDLKIQLGWIGVLLFAACLAAGALCAVARFAKVRDGYFSVLILMLFSVQILSESFVLDQNDLIWALFVCALARLTANYLEPAPTASVTDLNPSAVRHAQSSRRTVSARRGPA